MNFNIKNFENHNPKRLNQFTLKQLLFQVKNIFETENKIAACLWQ